MKLLNLFEYLFLGFIITVTNIPGCVRENPRSLTTPDFDPLKRARQPFVNIKSVIPDIEIDVRYATTNNFTGEIIDGYKKPYCWLLPKTVAALKKVQEDLKKSGLGLKIFDGYRPIRGHRHLIRWTRKNRPDWLGVYVGSGINMKSKFGHSCGNTVDLTLIHLENRKELNMGTDFDYFGKMAWTFSCRGEVFKNRIILFNTMKKYGFVNYSKEWWHYTYYDAPSLPYDMVIE